MRTLLVGGLWLASASASLAQLPEPDLLAQPPSVASALNGPSASPALQRLPTPDAPAIELPAPGGEASYGWTLPELEGMALQANPAIAAAAARVSAARGTWVQVGLAPNPELGYAASEVGNDGRAGQQGLYVGQEFVRGNKLALNRAVAEREIARLEQELAAARLRVLTDVRQRFYEALLAQRLVEVAGQLEEVSGAAVRAAETLLQAGEGRRTDLLQAQVEAQRATARVRQARAAAQAARRQLAAVVGVIGEDERPLVGSYVPTPWTSDWETTLSQLLATSPEVAAAVAELQRAQRVWQRESVEPIPNLLTQGMVQYDDATDYTLAGIQAGVSLPLWNRNQGAIGRAQADVAAARRELERVELALQQRLAAAWSQFEQSTARVEALEQGMLQRAGESLDLVRRGYEAGEISYVELLTAQRTYFETNLEYVEALGELNASTQLLRGSLLSESLTAPAR